jgi:hypothetical protein
MSVYDGMSLLIDAAEFRDLQIYCLQIRSRSRSSLGKRRASSAAIVDPSLSGTRVGARASPFSRRRCRPSHGRWPNEILRYMIAAVSESSAPHVHAYDSGTTIQTGNYKHNASEEEPFYQCSFCVSSPTTFFSSRLVRTVVVVSVFSAKVETGPLNQWTPPYCSDSSASLPCARF